MGVRDNIMRGAHGATGATGVAPMLSADFTRELVRAILERPLGFEWSLQGLGMLRAYLNADKVHRLHVWDSRFQVENVSRMHTHPWDFVSRVVAGTVEQNRYLQAPSDPEADGSGWPRLSVHKQLLFCGADGELEGEPETIVVNEFPRERYGEGMLYLQHANEIHVSRPLDGSVTLVERTFGSDVDHAFVFWPEGEQWVSAAPRDATPSEVITICERALDTWFR